VCGTGDEEDEIFKVQRKLSLLVMFRAWMNLLTFSADGSIRRSTWGFASHSSFSLGGFLL
jgi:hypothetical protein